MYILRKVYIHGKPMLGFVQCPDFFLLCIYFMYTVCIHYEYIYIYIIYIYNIYIYIYI